MSMTFWAYTQVAGKVSTDNEDLSYIYQFLDQLDALCRAQQFTEISELCNYSDALSIVNDEMEDFDEFSDYDDDIHEGSDEVVWMAAHEARDLFVYLINALESNPAILEIEAEEYERLCEEITACVDIIHTALEHDADATFNLSLIM